MKEFDTLKEGQKVETVIMGPGGEEVYRDISDGIHNADEAVEQAIRNAGLTIPAEACVFYVTDLATKMTRSYRINADGNVTEIV